MIYFRLNLKVLLQVKVTHSAYIGVLSGSGFVIDSLKIDGIGN